MSCLVTNPTSQFINPYHGNPLNNAHIYIGKKDTDALVPDNWQSVYLLGEDDSKTPITQPLRTNAAGVIVYNGKPITVWIDDAYSIVIIGVDGRQLYKSLYVEDPTYWLRRDLATLPTAEFPKMGVGLVAGAAPLNSPIFTGDPRAPTPPTGDSDTTIATTAFVTKAIGSATASGVTGGFEYWLGPSVPTNALLLDGSQASKTKYAGLYAVIGDTYATANGLVPDSASFYLPDVRSRFPRGADNGAGRSSSAVFMKYYADNIRSHTHDFHRGGWNADGNDHNNDEGLWGSGTDKTQITLAFGGAETMPMCIAFLPIVWAVSGATKVSAWWEEPQHLATQPDVHHTDELTGELLGNSSARPSPLEPGVWLTPAHATQTPPPTEQPGAVRCFVDGIWQHDAVLYETRQQAAQVIQATREQQNTRLMNAAKKREAIDNWLKDKGAPFSLSDIENPDVTP